MRAWQTWRLAEEKLGFDLASKTWFWKCLPADPKDKSADCSVTASVYCGNANGKTYKSEDEIKLAGACGGAKGELFADKINNKGGYWEWVCQDSEDPKVFAICQANTGICGTAGNKTFSESYFNTEKLKLGFLCEKIMAEPSSQYDNYFRVNTWKWKCGSTECSARKLACGEANNNYYVGGDFYGNRVSRSTFLCSSGNEKVLNYFPSEDMSGNNTITYDPGWSWNCLGDDGVIVRDCSARRYKCGYAVYGYLLKDIFNQWWSNPLKSDNSCAYDAKRVLKTTRDDGDLIDEWQCQDPKNATSFESCYLYHSGCGTAIKTGGYYYKESLLPHLGKYDGFLCNKYTWRENAPRTKDDIVMSDDGLYWTWTCRDNFGNSTECSVNRINCGTGDGKKFYTSSDWRSCVSVYDNDNKCLCSNGNKNAIPRDPALVKNAYWTCKDSDGYAPSTNQCSAMKGKDW